MKNRITSLLGITYPIIQGGMVWTSGWKLVSAVSNAGGLGLIGSGSMYPDELREQIRKCKKHTDNPFGVNIPLMYRSVEQHIATVIEERVPIVFTSAGNPKTWTETLKKEGIRVVHVVSSSKFAVKAQDAGVNAIVAEGFEAGGHNGREETTTFTLIPSIKSHGIEIPIVAAGGIADGKAMLAAMILGAEGVQIGSRFAASSEASCHDNFKLEIVKAEEGETVLTLKEFAPVRIIKNKFYEGLMKRYKNNASKVDIETYIKGGSAKLAMFQGEVDSGKLEIGQVSSMISDIKPAATIVKDIVRVFKETRRGLGVQL